MWSPQKSIFVIFYFIISIKEKTEQVATKLCDLNGDKALKERQCRNGLIKFRSGDFSLKDEPRSGRQSNVDEDDIKVLIVLDHHVTVREIEAKLKIPKSTVRRHIKNLGLVKKLDIWVPHDLKKNAINKRF